VIGKHVSSYYPSDYLIRREQEILPALRRREHWQGEQMLVFPDGQRHPTLHTIFPVRDENGELFCTAAVIADITELKRAEDELRQSYEALRQSQTMLDDFFGASPAILNIVDEEFRYLKTDGVTPTYFGLDAQGIMGKSVKDLAPQWFEAYGAMVQRVVETGEPVLNLEVQSPVSARHGGNCLLAGLVLPGLSPRWKTWKWRRRF